MSFIEATQDPRQAQALLEQLEGVYAAREHRLAREREALDAQRREIEDALARIDHDATMIAFQRDQWAGHWRRWQTDGGSLATARRLNAQKHAIEAAAQLNAAHRDATTTRLSGVMHDIALLERRRRANEARQSQVEDDHTTLRRQREAAQTRSADDTAEERAALAWMMNAT